MSFINQLQPPSVTGFTAPRSQASILEIANNFHFKEGHISTECYRYGDESKAKSEGSSEGKLSLFFFLFQRSPPSLSIMLNQSVQQAFGSNNDDFEALWSILGSALREIHTKNASSLSFEELYRSSYKIVLKGKGDELYERVKQLEQEWLSSLVSQTIMSSVSPVLLLNIDPTDVADQANERRAAGEKFLAAMRGAWEDHQLCMGMITDVLMYMV